MMERVRVGLLPARDGSIPRAANEFRVNSEGIERARLDLAMQRDSWRQYRAERYRRDGCKMDDVLKSHAGIC